MPYDPKMSVVLALAVDQAYKKYKDPNHKIQLGNYVVKAEIFVYELGSKVFFGFAASGSFAAGYPVNNMVALRGTQTDEEGFYDLEDWNLTPCVLAGASCGKVASGLLGFYSGATWPETSLAQSIQGAVKALVSGPPPGPPLYFAAHSLGGPMATLGALETTIARSYPTKPILYTFASLHVGDQTFVNSYAKWATEVYRVANLADWVPSFTGLTADTPGYVHVGLLCSFLWQTDGDWSNHSLENIYLKVVQNYPQVVKVGPRKYPQ
jgi:hypothetical protein